MAAAASTLLAVLLYAAAAAAFFSGADAKTTTAAGGGDLVTKTCADIISHDWKRLSDDKKFCESRLRLDKRSATAKHPRDLAIVAMDLAKRAAADADAKIAGVLRSSAAGHRINATAALILRNCRLDYASVASTIPVCRAMADGYKPGAGGQQQVAPNDHFECARRLRLDAWNCFVNVVFGAEDWSELAYKEIKEARLRIELVEAMLEEMLGIVIDDHFATLV
ncbi:unnamed protein product [Urochloa humidicola]